MVPILPLDSFVMGPSFPVFSPFQLCLDCALNRQNRRQSVPDNKLAPRRGKGGIAQRTSRGKSREFGLVTESKLTLVAPVPCLFYFVAKARSLSSKIVRAGKHMLHG